MGVVQLYRRRINGNEFEHIRAEFEGDFVKWSRVVDNKLQNEMQIVKSDFINMLHSQEWEEDLNTFFTMVGNKVEMKTKTPLQIEFDEAVRNAEREIQGDQQLLRLIQRINKSQPTINKLKEDRRRLNRLATLGVVTVLLDNTIAISPIGKKVLSHLRTVPVT